jgi:hypothetical protein
LGQTWRGGCLLLIEGLTHATHPSADPTPQIHAYNFSMPGWQPAAIHFTQLVWRDATELGCASNPNCSWPTHVCRFGPGGGGVPGGVAEWSAQVAPARTASRARASGAKARAAGAAAAAEADAATARSEAEADAAAAASKALALERTNGYRARHGVDPVAWDADLAASAAVWAAGCPAAPHSGGAGVGENVARGGALPDIGAAIDLWYSEVRGGLPAGRVTAACGCAGACSALRCRSCGAARAASVWEL